MDAIELLTQQHREVDTLFLQAEKLQGEEKARLLARIAEKLTIHAQIEEKHFYPFARSAGIQDKVEHSLEEHLKVKKMLADILACRVDDPKLQGLARELMENVQHHVKEEESGLFPQVRSLCSTEQLADVGGRMSQEAQSLMKKDVLSMAEMQASMQR